MKVFADYAKMDYYGVCHTEISKWYGNLYRKMLESGECTIFYTPNYKLNKQNNVAGGILRKRLRYILIAASNTPLNSSIVGTRLKP